MFVHTVHVSSVHMIPKKKNILENLILNSETTLVFLANVTNNFLYEDRTS